jgi:hypothetical protein
MNEADFENIWAKEKYSDAHPREVSDNGPQFEKGRRTTSSIRGAESNPGGPVYSRTVTQIDSAHLLLGPAQLMTYIVVSAGRTSIDPCEG